MKRWNLVDDSWVERAATGRFVDYADAEALRIRAEKAEADLAQLAARLAEIERGAWGWLKDDPERVASEFDAWFDDAQDEHDWPDGTIVEWAVIAQLRTERYRIRRHTDDDGCVSYTYEKEAANG